MFVLGCLKKKCIKQLAIHVNLTIYGSRCWGQSTWCWPCFQFWFPVNVRRTFRTNRQLQGRRTIRLEQDWMKGGQIKGVQPSSLEHMTLIILYVNEQIPKRFTYIGGSRGFEKLLHNLFFSLNNQMDALIIQIYSVIKLYIFRDPSLPIIGSFLLYIRHW
jgi:hypothetical protein